MKKRLAILSAAMVLCGCTHVTNYTAVDQHLFTAASSEALAELSIPVEQMRGKKVYLRMVGFEGAQRTAKSFREEYPATGIENRKTQPSDAAVLFEEKLIERLRLAKIELTPLDNADLEFVVQNEVNGIYIEKTYFLFLLPDITSRQYKIQLHTYLFDIKAQKVLSSADAVSGSKFEIRPEPSAPAQKPNPDEVKKEPSNDDIRTLEEISIKHAGDNAKSRRIKSRTGQ